MYLPSNRISIDENFDPSTKRQKTFSNSDVKRIWLGDELERDTQQNATEGRVLYTKIYCLGTGEIF